MSELNLHWSKLGQSGRPVLLLHGFANSGAWWMPWAIPLSRHYRVFLPDLPGHGSSQNAPPPGPDLLAEIANALERYLAAEKLEDICLVGFSFGAYLGQYLLTHRPDLPITRFLNIEHPPWSGSPDYGMSAAIRAQFGELVRLVGEDPQLPRRRAAELPSEIQDAYLKAIACIAEKSLDNQAATWLVQQMMGSGTIRRWIMNQVEWPWGYAIIRDYFEARYDFREQLKTIRVPCWAVGTKEASLFAGDPLPYFASQIPDCRTIYFEGSSHGFMFRHPLQFNALLEQFLTSKR